MLIQHYLKPRAGKFLKKLRPELEKTKPEKRELKQRVREGRSYIRLAKLSYQLCSFRIMLMLLHQLSLLNTVSSDLSVSQWTISKWASASDLSCLSKKREKLYTS